MRTRTLRARLSACATAEAVRSIPRQDGWADRARFSQRSESDLMRSYLRDQDLRIDWQEHDLGYLREASVLIVGGGGTIGARLAQQISSAGCRNLVLADSGEDGLYRVRRTLLERGHSPGRLSIELVDVCDPPAIDHVFATHRPTVVFHYANYKSAALGESAARAFVRVNVAGTRTLLEAVRRSSTTDRFVYISSDKAEKATTNYGRTKRICELLLRTEVDAPYEPPPARYAALRYCNVLDAAGSFAIPTFRDQIMSGLPVTIRRMPDGAVPNRYFVDIRTAAHLALIVGARVDRGEVYSVNPDRVTPIDVDQIAVMLAREFGVHDLERWSRDNVVHVSATPGEKVGELLGHGTPVPASPLADLHAPGPHDPVAFQAAVSEMLSVVEEPGDDRAVELLDHILRTHDPADADRATTTHEEGDAVATV